MKPTPSLLFRLLNGILLTLIIVFLYLCVKDIHPFNPKVINSALISLTAYALTAVSINKLLYFPGKQSWLHILPAVGIGYSSVFAVNALVFITFSNSFVLAHGLLATLFFVGDFVRRNRHTPRMAYIPLGRASQADQLPHAEWVRLPTAMLPHQNIQAVVADLHSSDLTPTWQKFLADCTLRGIPVYNIRQIEESLTGRVKIRHMYENDLGSLLPPAAYMIIKRFLDIVLVLLMLPFALPIMFLTAIVVFADSRGKVLFTQNRVGQGGREFRIYKFRSMYANSEANGAQLAQIGDQRITRVGQFIRKTRLDELPQFFNILKGDMSLIGPRPEQKVFVEKFEQSIPFYNYRHIVKPGLSGWAQVTHGYASNTDETQIKIEHDFYYIKHFSFSLDLLIAFKTIRIILTGFGAR